MRPDFVKDKVFAQVANKKNDIDLNDLISFLKSNNFEVKREDLEAILRRIDHEGNQMINLEEFIEATAINEMNLDISEEEKQRQGKSPIKDDLEKQLSSERKRGRSNSKKELLHDEFDEAIEKYESAEKDRKQKEQKNPKEKSGKKLNFEDEKKKKNEISEEEDQQEKPIHFKLMSLLKNQLKMEKDVEIQRESLFSHENFSAIDAFKMIDHDNKGYITVDDLENISQRFNIDLISTQTVMNLFDRDLDG